MFPYILNKCPEINKDNIGISTKDKIIYITKVKPFGKKEMSALDFINGLDKEKVLNSIVEWKKEFVLL